MLKAEFRFFHVDFVPFFKFRIGSRYRHDQETTWLAACPVNFFSPLKSFFKKTCYVKPCTGPHPCTALFFLI